MFICSVRSFNGTFLVTDKDKCCRISCSATEDGTKVVGFFWIFNHYVDSRRCFFSWIWHFYWLYWYLVSVRGVAWMNESSLVQDQYFLRKMFEPAMISITFSWMNFIRLTYRGVCTVDSNDQGLMSAVDSDEIGWLMADQSHGGFEFRNDQKASSLPLFLSISLWRKFDKLIT